MQPVAGLSAGSPCAIFLHLYISFSCSTALNYTLSTMRDSEGVRNSALMGEKGERRERHIRIQSLHTEYLNNLHT